MKKRMRKKLYLGEFQEFGFEVQFRLPADLSEPDQEAFFDAFMSEAIDSHGLLAGGGCGTEWDIFVTLADRGSAEEKHQKLVEDWLGNSPLVADIRIGPLVDAWN
jgi:uncharacterized protein YggL (DUF469 family)